MNSQQQLTATVQESIDKGLKARIFPGCITGIRVRDEAPLIVPRGKVAYTDDDHSIDEHTVYDMASVTKVVVTLTATLITVQEGKLSFNDPITKYIPELSQHDDSKENITVYHLLTHTSGLPDWRPYFIRLNGREAYVDAIAREKMISKPGEQVKYSDPGFMLLGFMLERIWDERLDQLAKRLVFEPFGLNHTYYLPLQSGCQRSRIAPTEDFGNGCERAMVEDYAARYQQGLLPGAFAVHDEHITTLDWREGLITGTVHDCNAHYGLNGVSGHAGLFSTLHDLFRFMDVWTDREGKHLLNPVLRDFAVRPHTGQLAPVRGIGWEVSPTGGTPNQVIAGCTGGDLVSAKAFGHTGFTGTAMWHDPVREATVITLANRIQPGPGDGMFAWRKMHHNAILSRVFPNLS